MKNEEKRTANIVYAIMMAHNLATTHTHDIQFKNNKNMKAIILMLLFSCILMNLHGQENANIKTVTIYSLKDTTGVNFGDRFQISDWKWYKRSYDKSGNLVQEIQYPFPHNSVKGTTKIIENQYLGDTLINKVLNEKNVLVSETVCINKDNVGECRSINYGSLNSSSFKELENEYIVVTRHDTINNLTTVTQLKKRGNQVDTLRRYEKPIFQERKKDSIGNNNTRKYVKIDTIKYSNLILYGSIETRLDDTISITYFQELEINPEVKFVEKLTINYEQKKTYKSNSLWKNGKIAAKTEYELKDNVWEVTVKESRQYNEKGDETLKIRDDYREGVFSYRYVTYYEYEYYQ